MATEQVCIVTGAGAGIGKAFAIRFSRTQSSDRRRFTAAVADAEPGVRFAGPTRRTS